uniref:Uncharacterized protein n=1 Tax=Romanomermis culicivorax TaxID=13658 RepID=A0A915L4A2_ROMCU
MLAIYTAAIAKSTHTLQSRNKFRGSSSLSNSDSAGLEGADLYDDHLSDHSTPRRKSKSRKA